MVNLEKEDVHAAFVLTWLKYVPVTEQDIQHMNTIHNKESKTSEKSKRKFVRIKKGDYQETPEVQIAKKVRDSSSRLVNFSRKPYGSRYFDGENWENQEAPEVELPKIVEKSKRKLVRIKKSENQEIPEVQFCTKVKKNSSNGLVEFSRKSYGSGCFDGAKLVSDKNQETPEIEFAQKVRNFSRKSNGVGCFGGEKLLNRKNQETPEVQRPKKVRISPSRMMNIPKKASGIAPKLPPIEGLRAHIGQCSNPFMKNLTKSDVDEHQGRLLLNNEDVKNHLFPMLNQEEFEDLGKGIEVKTFDPMGNFYNMRFKTWGNGKSYVILASWKQFIQEHKLKDNDCVTVWMFRENQTNDLCFALTWKKDGDEEEAPSSNSDSSIKRHEFRGIQK